MISTAVTAFPRQEAGNAPPIPATSPAMAFRISSLASIPAESHCCTVATILELGKDAVTPIGRIDGIDGLPFEGLEVRKLTKGASWQCIAHRPYMTACGTHYDAADVLAVYALHGDHFQDQTVNFGDFLQEVLRQDLAKWRQEKNRTMDLLQTLAVDFAVVGQKDAGKRFFALNLTPINAQSPKSQRGPECLPRCPGKSGRSRARSGAVRVNLDFQICDFRLKSPRPSLCISVISEADTQIAIALIAQSSKHRTPNYSTASSQFSRICLIFPMNRSATAPSITRWS